jgi:hypothetical protein
MITETSEDLDTGEIVWTITTTKRELREMPRELFLRFEQAIDEIQAVRDTLTGGA